MKLPDSAHTDRPWRIHEMTEDFRVEDVWLLPTPGGSDGFADLMTAFRTIRFPDSDTSMAVRFVWETRWKLGALLGLDRDKTGLGSRVPSLRERLPEDLRGAPTGSEYALDGFGPLYLLADEYAAELANKTMHAVLHLGWVPDGTGGYRGQMAILVKPNGRFGAAYMEFIKPFRRLLIYPALLRKWTRVWPRYATHAVVGRS